MNRNPRFYERSNSFNGKSGLSPTMEKLRRPKTVPDLKTGMRNGVVSPSMEEFKSKRLTKVLVNVTIQGSVGTVQVLISPDLTVKDLIIAAIKQYAKEGRRPFLSCTNLEDFSLHYSQFSLESNFLPPLFHLKKKLFRNDLGSNHSWKNYSLFGLIILVGHKLFVSGVDCDLIMSRNWST